MDKRRPLHLSLDFLRGFQAAARHLSFTRAAQELFVTQPAISREIRTLEDQLGRPLFRRVNRTLQLTEAGQELYLAVNDALAVLDAATERIARATRRLSVSTTTALASLWLVPKLPRFTAHHPEIDVRVAATNDAVDVSRENIDVLLRFVPPWMERPAGRPVIEYSIFPVCAPPLLRATTGGLRDPADLARHTVIDFDTIVYGRPWSDWQQWCDGMRLKDLRPRATLRFSHYDQVMQSAIAGAGVAIGKWPHTLNALAEGRLVPAFGPAAVVARGGYYLVTRPETSDGEVVAAFVDWLRDEVLADSSLPFAPPRHDAPGDAGEGRRRAPRRARSVAA